MINYGCCKNPTQTQHQTEVTTQDGYKYIVVIVYCKGCGSQKATSNIKHVK